MLKVRNFRYAKRQKSGYAKCSTYDSCSRHKKQAADQLSAKFFATPEPFIAALAATEARREKNLKKPGSPFFPTSYRRKWVEMEKVYL